MIQYVSVCKAPMWTGKDSIIKVTLKQPVFVVLCLTTCFFFFKGGKRVKLKRLKSLSGSTNFPVTNKYYTLFVLISKFWFQSNYIHIYSRTAKKRILKTPWEDMKMQTVCLYITQDTIKARLVTDFDLQNKNKKTTTFCFSFMDPYDSI